MDAITQFEGLVVPLDRSNVDTDALIPKQYIKSIERTGFGRYLFDEWRFLDAGEPGMEESQRQPNPAFALNQPRYQGAQILLTRENMGCGSSREHAVWALKDYGIRVVIAPSFAEIFYGNCFKNAILPIVLDAGTVDALFKAVEGTPGYQLRVDLPAQTLTAPDGQVIAFDIDPFFKHRLVNGLDDIDLTLAQNDAIARYEAQRRKQEPWLFV